MSKNVKTAVGVLLIGAVGVGALGYLISLMVEDDRKLAAMSREVSRKWAEAHATWEAGCKPRGTPLVIDGKHICFDRTAIISIKE